MITFDEQARRAVQALRRAHYLPPGQPRLGGGGQRDGLGRPAAPQALAAGEAADGRPMTDRQAAPGPGVSRPPRRLARGVPRRARTVGRDHTHLRPSQLGPDAHMPPRHALTMPRASPPRPVCGPRAPRPWAVVGLVGQHGRRIGRSLFACCVLAALVNVGTSFLCEKSASEFFGAVSHTENGLVHSKRRREKSPTPRGRR